MIAAIIQARMGSTRLPGKVMLEFSGHPVLWHVVNRVQQAKYIDTVIVATSEEKIDTVIVNYCKENNINCFVGSQNDVLDRYYKAASYFGLGKNDAVVRITADCPLIDPIVVDNVITTFLLNKADYASNTNPPTFPDGLDTEIFTFEALSSAWEKADLLSEREHVTPYIRKLELFKKVNVTNCIDISELRWTLDENEDFEALAEIYNGLYNKDQIFYMNDILKFLDTHKQIKDINKKYQRNEGYAKSLKNDRKLSKGEMNNEVL